MVRRCAVRVLYVCCTTPCIAIRTLLNINNNLDHPPTIVAVTVALVVTFCGQFSLYYNQDKVSQVPRGLLVLRSILLVILTLRTSSNYSYDSEWFVPKHAKRACRTINRSYFTYVEIFTSTRYVFIFAYITSFVHGALYRNRDDFGLLISRFAGIACRVCS